MGRGRLLVSGLLLVGVLVACGDDDDGGGGQAATVGEITLVSTGGIDGATIELVIGDDGTGTETFAGEEPREFTMSDDDVSRLHQLVASDEFADLDASYLPDDNCCDLFFYELTAEVGNDTITVETADNAEQPTVLSDVLALIDTATD